MPTSSVERLSELISAAAAVVGEVDLARVLRRLVSEARSATGAEYAALGVLGPHGVLTDFIYEGIGAEQAAAIGSLPRGRGVLGTVVREKTTIVVDDIANHPDSYGFPEHHPPMTSFLGVPVRAGEEVYGNLYLTEKPGGFDHGDVALVESLAVVAGSAVNTTRLRERLAALAITEDRHRIARDLHDTIIQELFAVGLSLQGQAERAESEASTAILNDAVDRLDSAVESLRGYIYELRSPSEPLPGLGRRLQDLARRMSAIYPIEVVVQAPPALSLGPEQEDELVKVAQEAVSNALRHSGASRVEVLVADRGDSITLEVVDDGSGFDPEAAHTGLGLTNMTERVDQLGGELAIHSEPGEGTRVVILLPRR